MALPFKVIDYPMCVHPPKTNETSDEEVDEFLRELSITMKKHDIEIICVKSLIE